LILSRASLKKHVFTAYVITPVIIKNIVFLKEIPKHDTCMALAGAPAIISNIDFIKDILRTGCVYGICSHIANHHKHSFYQGYPSKVTCLRHMHMQPYLQSSQALILAKTFFKNERFAVYAATGNHHKQ
jgi:hypothetical protein